MNRTQDGYMMLDKPYRISKEGISTIYGLCGDGPVLVKRSIKSKEVEAVTSVMGDQRALLIDTIIHPMVRYVAYGVSYKNYLWNREGSIFAIAVYIVHQMVKEDKDFNLCELLLMQLT